MISLLVFPGHDDDDERAMLEEFVLPTVAPVQPTRLHRLLPRHRDPEAFVGIDVVIGVLGVLTEIDSAPSRPCR